MMSITAVSLNNPTVEVHTKKVSSYAFEDVYPVQDLEVLPWEELEVPWVALIQDLKEEILNHAEKDLSPRLYKHLESHLNEGLLEVVDEFDPKR